MKTFQKILCIGLAFWTLQLWADPVVDPTAYQKKVSAQKTNEQGTLSAIKNFQGVVPKAATTQCESQYGARIKADQEALTTALREAVTANSAKWAKLDTLAKDFDRVTGEYSQISNKIKGLSQAQVKDLQAQLQQKNAELETIKTNFEKVKSEENTTESDKWQTASSKIDTLKADIGNLSKCNSSPPVSPDASSANTTNDGEVRKLDSLKQNVDKMKDTYDNDQVAKLIDQLAGSSANGAGTTAAAEHGTSQLQDGNIQGNPADQSAGRAPSSNTGGSSDPSTPAGQQQAGQAQSPGAQPQPQQGGTPQDQAKKAQGDADKDESDAKKAKEEADKKAAEAKAAADKDKADLQKKADDAAAAAKAADDKAKASQALADAVKNCAAEGRNYDANSTNEGHCVDVANSTGTQPKTATFALQAAPPSGTRGTASAVGDVVGFGGRKPATSTVKSASPSLNDMNTEGAMGCGDGYEWVDGGCQKAK